MNESEESIPDLIGWRGQRDWIPLAKKEGIIEFGQYMLSDMDAKQFIIAHPSGECGVFDRAAFETHIAAFFGLHF